MRTWSFLVLVVLLGWPVAAGADSFEGSELLVGRSVKQPVGAKRFAIGVRTQFAPLNLVLSSQKNAILDAGIEAACREAPDPAECARSAREHSDDALDALGTVREQDWVAVSGAISEGDAALRAQLQAAGITDPDALDAVSQFMTAVPEDQREEAANLSRALTENEATTVMFEPYVEMNFSLLSVSTSFPLAMMMFDGSTDWHLGNVVLDAKFGHVWGNPGGGLALSYGASLYLPTGTREADALGLADLFSAPKFTHSHLGVAPYVVVGFQIPLVVVQGHAEFVSGHGVRDVEGRSSLQYLKYGGGLVLAPRFLLSLVAEVNGMAPISDSARAYDAVFAVGGVQLKLMWLKASLAAQVPLRTPAGEDTASLGGVSMGEMADYSILGRVGFTF